MRSRWLGTVVVWVGSVILFTTTGPPVPAGSDAVVVPGATEYLQGLNALETAAWKQAAAAFGKAIDADEENADYHTARGVAHTLDQQFPAAMKDLHRSLKLRPDDWETELWLATAIKMNGDPMRASQLFNHGAPEDHDYADLVYSAAQSYWESSTRGRYFDRETRRQVEVNKPVTTSFPQMGKQFAERHKAAAGVPAGATFEQAKQQIAADDPAAALRDLDLLIAKNPEDIDLLVQHVRCLLPLGNVAQAREELTRILIARPDDAAGYAMRAFANARLGNAARARADLQLAERLAPAEAATWRPQIEGELAQAVPSSSPQELADRMQQSARDGATPPQLVEQAIALQRAVNARRLRVDESYQEQLRQLVEPTRQIPASADSLAALGEFLYREATAVRGEAVEPRATFTTFRWCTQASQAAELQQAEKSLDAALAIDPNHVQALTFKAACQMWRARWADAERTLRQALAIRADYPPLLHLFTEVLDHAATVKAAEAAELRDVETWSDLEYIYWRYPSAAELEQADEYDRQASALWALAANYLQSAAQVEKGTADGAYYEGIIARRNNDLPAARAAFERAVALDPKHLAANDQLAGVLGALRLTAEAHEAQLRAVNLAHTTAGPMLRLAWQQVPRTAWKSAGKALDRAAEIDPADPRLYAYRGVVAAQREDTEEAIAQYRCALAICEAAARARGTSLQRNGTAPLRGDDAALAMAVRLRLASLLEDEDQAADALELYRDNLALEQRLAPADRYRPMVCAMMPDPDAQENAASVPQAEPPIAMFAGSQVGMGQSLLADRQLASAREAFDAAIRCENAWPATVSGRECLYVATSRARVGLAKVALAEGKPDDAFRVMTREGFPGHLPDALRQEIKQTNAEINTARQNARSRPPPRPRGPG